MYYNKDFYFTLKKVLSQAAPCAVIRELGALSSAALGAIAFLPTKGGVS